MDIREKASEVVENVSLAQAQLSEKVLELQALREVIQVNVHDAVQQAALSMFLFNVLSTFVGVFLFFLTYWLVETKTSFFK
tara:strand:- start:183 stop:425 length:243 start_codon:yes stop_codon:yes gene_type:complete